MSIHIDPRARGFTCVPNVHYWSTDKFVFGAVLEINDIPYFVPISSYSRNQQDLILMKDKNDGHILGSLRLNYMIPVPDHLLYKLDINALPTINNRIHTSKELAFCRRNRDKIRCGEKYRPHRPPCSECEYTKVKILV